LDEVGLGDYCLELHSHKAKKMDIITQLRSTAEQPKRQIHYDENAFRELEHLKSELREQL